MINFNFKSWLAEVYHGNIGYLHKYLKSQDLDLVNHMREFLKWPGSTAVLRKLKINKKALSDDLEVFGDEVYAAESKINAYFNTPEGKVEREKFSNYLYNYLMQHDPANAPSWMTMDSPKILKRETWLIHFTDHVDEIARKGFTIGMDDMTRLALTTHFRDTAKSGGYNFAFPANSRYADNAAAAGKYGKHAVMFQAAGVKVWHGGDEEDQVVFWGPSIPKNTLVFLTRTEDGWGVETRSGHPREFIYQGEFRDVVNWVEKNWQQYRRHIFG